MKKSDIEGRTEQLVQPILDEAGYELWDVEYVKEGSDYYLRVYADKEGGFTIEDCVAVSRALEKKLDEEDFIEEAYILEVSSPGLTRQLKKDRDFERCIGRLVKVNLYKAIDGEKSFVGVLSSFSDEAVSILAEDPGAGKKKDEIQTKLMDIPRENISAVRLEFEEQ